MTDLNTNFPADLNTEKKISILLWNNHNPKLPNSFILKKDGQKYLGLARVDKKGETYWSFKEFRPKKSPKESPNFSPNKIDNIAKFEQRQAKTQQINHGKSNTEPAVNEQSQSDS